MPNSMIFAPVRAALRVLARISPENRLGMSGGCGRMCWLGGMGAALIWFDSEINKIMSYRYNRGNSNVANLVVVPVPVYTLLWHRL